MKKILLYLCVLFLSATSLIGQGQKDEKTKQAIEEYESKISQLLPKKKYNQAFKYYKKIIDLYESNNLDQLELAHYYAQAGSMMYGLNSLKKALKYQQKTVAIRKEKLDPLDMDLVTSLNDLVKTYKRLGKYEDALGYQHESIAIIEQTLSAKHPSLAISYGKLGEIYEILKETELGLEYYEKAIIILEKIEGYEEELAYYKKSIHILNRRQYDTNKVTQYETEYVVPKRNLDFLNALELYHKKEYSAALQGFNNLNLKDDEMGEIWDYIGLCHYHLDDYPKAIEAYGVSVELAPKLKQRHYYNNIGVAYAKNRQFEQAEQAFIKYEKVLLGDYWHHRNWAIYYALQNKKKQAIAQLQKAIKLGYDDIKWLETDNSLESIRGDEAFDKLLNKLKQ